MPKRVLILYVDEESKNLKLFFMHFKIHKEFIIHLASSVHEAFEILAALTVHIIIVNPCVSAATGMEFLDKIPKRKNNPVKIVLTASNNKEEMERAMERDVIFCHHQMPYNFDELKSAIEEAYRQYCDARK